MILLCTDKIILTFLIHSKPSISLACEFLATVLRIFWQTFARHSCECRASVVRIFMRTGREGLVHVSCDGRATVLRKHANTSRLSGEKIKLSDIRTNVVRHSHECRATVVRMKMKISYSRGILSRMSRDCHTTVAPRDCHTTVARLSRDSREIYMYFQNYTEIREFVA